MSPVVISPSTVRVDQRIVRFQRDPDAGVIINFPNVQNTDDLKLHVVGKSDSANLREDLRIPASG